MSAHNGLLTNMGFANVLSMRGLNINIDISPNPIDNKNKSKILRGLFCIVGGNDKPIASLVDIYKSDDIKMPIMTLTNVDIPNTNGSK